MGLARGSFSVKAPHGLLMEQFHDTATLNYTAEDFRFTEKNGKLYAIELGWPANHLAVIRSVVPANLKDGEQVRLVRLLGSEGDLRFQQLPDGLHVSLPNQSTG